VAERLAAIKPFFDAHAEEMHPVTRAITAGGVNFSAVDTFEAQHSVLRKGRVANEVWRHADVLLVPTSGTIYTLAQVAENPVQLNSNLVTWVALVVRHFLTTRVTCRDMRRVTGLNQTVQTHHRTRECVSCAVCGAPGTIVTHVSLGPPPPKKKLLCPCPAAPACTQGYYTNFVNLLDMAAVAVPTALREDGLPAGATFIGPTHSDALLCAVGDALHRGVGSGTVGATAFPVAPLVDPSPVPAVGPTTGPKPGHCRLAVVGAHLQGLPLNWQLTDRGATLVAATTTAPAYRLFALPGTSPPKPGMVKVAGGPDDAPGVSIAVEVWELPLEHYGGFVAGVPSPLCIGTLTLVDGSSVQGFLCEAHAVQGGGVVDISHHGGWRKYLASLATAAAATAAATAAAPAAAAAPTPAPAAPPAPGVTSAE
jgi:hypothetical protein